MKRTSQMSDYTIFIPWHGEYKQRAKDCSKRLKPENTTLFDGNGYSSFSKLTNAIWSSCETEKIIVVNSKAFATAQNIKTMVNRLDEGYAFVGLSHWYFYATTKQVIEKVGWMDERYVGGGYEDLDWHYRCIGNDLAYLEDIQVDWLKKSSTWDATLCKEFFNKKWGVVIDSHVRLISEEKYDYKLGEVGKIKLLDHSHTYPDSLKNRKVDLNNYIL